MKKENKINIALTWGWTWWHIFPLLSTYNFLKENDELEFFWFWEEEGLEFDIALQNNINFIDIPAWKIRRYFDWRNFFEPLKNITGIFFGIYFLLRYRINFVFSKGWYVSLPLCIAAFLLRKKIYIHESDTVTWVSNKLISKLATKVFYTFPNEKTENKLQSKHIFIGQILNPDILDWIKSLKIDENMYLNVIVIAWSQGSTRIFENLIKVLPKLNFVDFTIILWEKNKHFKKDFIKYENVRTFDFISQKDLGKILKQTDIAITRAWATTLWELTVFGIHSIIVPLTESAWNHQQKNAEFFKKTYWSDILNEEEDLAENIFKKLEKYKNLRKNWLYLENFYKPLEIIEREILGDYYDFDKIIDENQIFQKEEIEEKEDILEQNYLEEKFEQEEVKQEKNFKNTENILKWRILEQNKMNNFFEQKELNSGKIIKEIEKETHEKKQTWFETHSLK